MGFFNRYETKLTYGSSKQIWAEVEIEQARLQVLKSEFCQIKLG